MPIQAAQVVKPQLAAIGEYQVFGSLFNDKCFYCAVPGFLLARLVLPYNGYLLLQGSGLFQQVVKGAGDGSVSRFRLHGR